MIGMKSVPWQVVVLAGGLLSQSGPAQAESFILPSSVFRTGANGAEYRTDVRVLNQGSSVVTVNATFYDQATSTTFPASPFPVEARSQVAFDNILQSLFGRTLSQGAYGPIRFDAIGPIIVASSVNNVNACGSGAVSGQWLPGIAASQAPKTGVIGQLAVSASTGSGYHTNLVFMNPGSVAATATVKVRRGGGALLSTGTIGPLPANGFTQVALDGAVFPGVAGTTDTNLWLEFSSDQPVLAYATMIHNVSGDPFAVVASIDTPPPPAQEEITVTLPGGVPLVMVRISKGTFQMGSPDAEPTRTTYETLHEVTLTRDYYLGKYVVTQAQWSAVTGTPGRCPLGSAGDTYPADCVSWDDISGTSGFLKKLNDHLTATGQPGAGEFRLPTEAEWERAARGGTQTRFSFGDALGYDGCARNPLADLYVWWCANSPFNSQPVGMKQPNQFGLYDMHGNVWEWCQDWGGAPYPASAQVDPTGPTTGTYRVVRGGSWYYYLGSSRSASRSWGLPSSREFIKGLGFRLARSL